MAGGWAPAKNIVFSGNRYFGKQIDRPDDATGTVAATTPAVARDWEGPQFDPAHPDDFAAFMVRHKIWLNAMMTAEFGAIPQNR